MCVLYSSAATRGVGDTEHSLVTPFVRKYRHAGLTIVYDTYDRKSTSDFQLGYSVPYTHIGQMISWAS